MISLGGSGRCVALMFVCASLVVAAPADAESDSFHDSAKRRFEEGKVEFDAKRFAPALELFKQSYAIAPYPALLFNIGRCQEELGLYTDAIDTFQRYLAVHPEAEVRNKLTSLRKKLASSPTPRPVTVTPPPIVEPVVEPGIEPGIEPTPVAVTVVPVAIVAPPPKRTPVYKRWYLWVPISVAAVGLGVGLGLGLGTHSDRATFPSLTATTP